jgi:hypothetical protein
LEEFLISCEEVQKKGGTFTYGYLLIAFTIMKWRPAMGRQLAIVDKGCLTKMFEPWHARPGSENMEFINVVFLKWYTQVINTTQSMCIPRELLNLNTRNISFSLNRQDTFSWPRHAKHSDFHTRPLSVYLDEHILDKDFISCPGFKFNLHKSGMHYLFPPELLKKKSSIKEVGSSSAKVELSQKSPTASYSK